jgi:hypothetical protein
MSYNIYFVRRRADLSWDELMEELEEAAQEASELPRELIEAWGRIVPQVEAVLGEIDLSEGADTLELGHDGTGIDLAIIGSEVSVAVPYWHTGDGATQIFDKIAAIASIVERETGLIAFDPQTERPFTEAVSVMSSNTEDLRSRYGG